MSDVLERTLAGLRGALAVTPDNGPLRLQVAQLLAELGRDSEALEQVRAALPHLPPGADRDAAEALIEQLRPSPPPENVTALPGAGGLQLLRGGPSEGGEDLPFEPTRERVDFSDVGGSDDVKESIRMRIVLPFQRPEVFRAYGKKTGGGILMYGPPGCGKTLLARATAGEVGARFLNVAIDQVLDMWFGGSEQKLAALFAEARRQAPAVLFFDEVEAIGANRQQLRGAAGRTLVNQLLAELDGISSDNDKLLVIAATNAPWHVDPALLRPGRFDRVVFVPPPDDAARGEILRLHLRGRPQEPSLGLDKVVAETAGWSGADLADLVDRALEAPLRDALRTGTQRPLSAADLAGALQQARPSTEAWFETAKNYATFANAGGVYDDLAAWLAARPKPKRRWTPWSREG
jgi:AAA+ superfamily predicted ATPase